MSDFIIGHVTDPKEGPLDGVYAETKGTYTKFKGTGAFQKEKRILHQKVADVGIKASLQTGMVSINDRNRSGSKICSQRLYRITGRLCGTWVTDFKLKRKAAISPWQLLKCS